jgi:glycosyltransferase involved in cell wall biosynthesis
MEPRVALAHDYLLVMRGAERTFAAMADVWPDAPIHTLLYDEEGTGRRFAGRDITTSALQRLNIDQHAFRKFLPLYPTATRQMKVTGHDLLVSSSSAFAHMMRTAPGMQHICYCHSPFRYAWHDVAVALAEPPAPLRPVLATALRRHRRLDRKAASGLKGLIANSRITQERVRRYWGREAPIVHPPVDVLRFNPAERSDDLLFVGEITRHKRVEVALEAAEMAGRRIRVVGEGPELPRLRQRFQRSAEFYGRVPDHELESIYATSGAMVVPNIEEFGIAAVEAQAAGLPVIAADAGGAQETVLPGETGWLVPPDDVDAFAKFLRRDIGAFDSQAIRRNAERFSTEAFQRNLRAAVEDLRA